MRILVAEDDPDTAELMAGALRADGHDIAIATAGDRAIALLRTGGFDIALLDRMLPVLDGMAVLREARGSGIATHVLMVTALGSIGNRVEGLEAGADDYLTKPFAMTELIARVHALQRRLGKQSETAVLRFGPLSMNILRRELRIGERLVALQPREFRLLEELVRGQGEILTRPMLLQKVWGFHFEPQTNLVETHMSRLRTKLALAGARAVIRTVRGVGYRLHVED